MAEPAHRLPDDDQPDIRPHFGVVNGEGQGDGVPRGNLHSVDNGPASGQDLKGAEQGFYNPKGDGAGAKSSGPLGVSGLASAEGSGSASRLGGSGAGNFGFTPNEQPSMRSRMRQFAVKNKRKGMIGGGIGGVIVLLLGLGFGALTSYEIVTIEKDLVGYESKTVQYFEKKAAGKLMQSIICRKLAPGSVGALASKCKNTGDSDDDESSAEEAQQDSDPLAKEVDSFDITDPDVVTALDNQGIKVNTDSDGNFTGLTDETTGDAITGDDVTNDSALFDRFEAALPEFDVGQLETFRPLMVDHSGSSFDVLSDTANDDPDKEVEDAVLDADPSENPDLLNAQSEDDQAAPGKNATAAEQKAYADGQGENGVTEKAIEATDKAIEAGDSGAEALAAGEAAAAPSPQSALLASTVVSDVCSVYKVANDASKARVPEIMSLLIRHFTTLVSVADQVKSGKVTGKEVSQVMSLLNGNSSASPTTKDSSGATVRNEESLPFSDSAAWQRIEGNPVNSDSKSDKYTPDIDPTSLPTANVGTQIVNDVDQIMGDTLVGPGLCAVENSAFGSIANGLLGVGQLIVSGFSFGTSELATVAVTTAFQETLQHFVIPQILKYFTPVGLFGRENSTQWMNNADAGANLSFNNYAQRLGGEPLTNSQANTETAEATNDQSIAEANESWTDRMFATSNPDSLVSRLAVDLPTTRLQATQSIASLFTNLPTTLGHDIATIFTPRSLAASNAQNPGAAYGITQYGFPSNDADKYDPIANEQYLYSNISYGGNTEPRITLLGNPNQYPNASDDSSTDDILHCFTQSYNTGTTPTGSLTGGNTDPICGTEGSYDYNNETPQPITDSNVAKAYCEQLAPDDPNCPTAILPQINDDIGHFREYLLDTEVMGFYTSITNNQ